MVAAGYIFLNSHGLDECGVLPDLNKPPVANAGDDQNFDCASALGLEVDLDGFGSSDPDNDELAFLWTEDEAGNTTTAQCFVQVPHDKKATAIDDGDNAGYTVTGFCGGKSGIIRGVDYQVLSPALELMVYPNPFSDNTEIVFDLAEETFAQLKIFDVSGRLIKTLASQNMAEGEQRYNWNAEDDHGNHVPNGLYFVVLVTKDEVSRRALVLAR